MKNSVNIFLRKCLLFFSILLAVVAVGELINRSDNTNPYALKHEYIMSHGSRIATLILGSSHTYYGLSPHEMGDSVYNLANISQSPEYDLDLLKRYLPMIPNLRNVIIPVSYFTFSYPRLEDSPEWRLCINYKIWMKAGGHSDFSKYNFTVSDLSSFTRRLKSAFGAGEKVNHCDSLGFGLGYSLEHRATDWEEKGKSRVAFLSACSSDIREQRRACLDSLILLCSNHDVDVTLIITPVWRTFRDNADSMRVNTMLKEVEELSRHSGVNSLNYYSSPLFEAQDFYDVDHLSDHGAAKLSRLVTEQLSEEKDHNWYED